MLAVADKAETPHIVMTELRTVKAVIQPMAQMGHRIEEAVIQHMALMEHHIVKVGTPLMVQMARLIEEAGILYMVLMVLLVDNPVTQCIAINNTPNKANSLGLPNAAPLRYAAFGSR